jgi:tRNA 2-selenouridine synthase
VRLLLEDYGFFRSDPEFFCERLDALVQLRGREQVHAWQAQVRAGDIEPWCANCSAALRPRLRQLDGAQLQGVRRSEAIAPKDRTPESMAALARELLSS